MAIKIKGFRKGFKYISQIFGVTAVKEREIEIGNPTDVKHVAHIGWDDRSGSAPGWMKEFRTASDFGETSIEHINNETRVSHFGNSPWSSQDFDSMNRQPGSDIFNNIPLVDLPKIPKNQKRKKSKSTSSDQNRTRNS